MLYIGDQKTTQFFRDSFLSRIHDSILSCELCEDGDSSGADEEAWTEPWQGGTLWAPKTSYKWGETTPLIVVNNDYNPSAAHLIFGH